MNKDKLLIRLINDLIKIKKIMCVQNKQIPWILVHHKLYGDVTRTEYPSHTKARNALRWRLKVIRDNMLDESAYLEPKNTN